MKKILVTGASGNVGRFVVEELLALGETVVAGGTKVSSLEEIFGERVTPVVLDFQNPDTFEQALAGVDRVFLMRPPHLGKASDMYPFVDAMKGKGIRLVSFLSLMGVEKNPFPPHGKIEKYLEEAQIPYAHIRPGFFMQNLSGIHAEEIRERGEIWVPAGKSRTSFIDARDIGRATAVVLHQWEKYQNTSHTLTGGEALDYYQVAEILTRVMGREIRYLNPGFLEYRRHYIGERKLDAGYVHVTMALYLMTRLGTAQGITEDFYRITGNSPRTLEEFAEENRSIFLKDTE